MKDDKILKKLDKLLKLYGVDDDAKREQFLNDVQDAKYDEEEIVDENNEEDLPNEKVEEPTEDVAPKEADGEEVETEQPETNDVDATTEENAEAEVEEQPQEAEVDPNEVNPANITPDEGVGKVAEENAQEVVPQVDPLEELKGKYEEMAKANEGLLARISALEEALKQGGVLTDTTESVGIDNPRTPANNMLDDPMTDVLREINKHSY